MPIDPFVGCPFGMTFIPSSATRYVSCTCPYPWDPSFPCSQPCNQIGACCSGTACSTTLPGDCPGAFQGTGAACGPSGNPTTCCPCNADGIGGVGVADVFVFLNRWLAADPGGDFNHDTHLTFGDVTDFIAAWFAGCS
jgi:hypothetical protein